MHFPTPLLPGRLLSRYKRFFADVELDSGGTVTAHCTNTGSLLTCKEPGSRAWVSRADNPNRKLQYTWELVQSGETLAGINTNLANRLAEEAVQAGRIPELSAWPEVKREVRYGRNSRIDLLLSGDGLPPCYVEVKNVTMGREGVAAFPDAVSTRAAKHMAELADQVREGHRAAVLFVVQRMDCRVVTAADDIDPAYGRALREAAEAGVQVLAWQADVSPEGIELVKALPVEL